MLNENLNFKINFLLCFLFSSKIKYFNTMQFEIKLILIYLFNLIRFDFMYSIKCLDNEILN